jgi:hypothetical protein
MRIALVLPLVLSLGAGCRSSNDDSARPDSAAAVSGLGGAPSTPTLGGACSAMARVTRGTLRIAVGRDRATTFAAPRPATGTWQGCRFVGNGTLRTDSAAATPDALLGSALATEGWTPEPRFSASGPAGSAFAVRRATALCAVTVTYTVGAPATGTGALPKPRPYRMEIRCTDDAAKRG